MGKVSCSMPYLPLMIKLFSFDVNIAYIFFSKTCANDTWFREWQLMTGTTLAERRENKKHNKKLWNRLATLPFSVCSMQHTQTTILLLLFFKIGLFSILQFYETYCLLLPRQKLEFYLFYNFSVASELLDRPLLELLVVSEIKENIVRMNSQQSNTFCDMA